MDKYFKSQSASQDVVGALFSDKVLMNIVLHFTEEYINMNQSGTPTIDSEQWKCVLTLEQAHKAIAKRIIPFLDTVEIASDIYNKVDLKAMKLKVLLENSLDDDLMYSKFIEVFLEDSKYIQALSKMHNLTPEQEQELIEILKNLEEEENIKDVRLSHLLKDEDFINDVFKLIQTAMLDSLSKDFMCNKIDEPMFTRFVAASKACVESFSEEYQLWEASTMNKQEQFLFLFSKVFSTKIDSSKGIHTLVTCIFFMYFYVYTEKGRYYLFEKTLKSLCNTPVKTGIFIKFIKEYEYGSDFCNAYRKYLDETGSTPLFNPDILIPVTMPLKLDIDTDKEHVDWFLPIQRRKFLKDSPKDIFDSLHKLYLALREENLIDYNTPSNLFIYRFSGLLKPIEPETTMKWTGTRTKLAILIHLLYNDGESRIPYAKVDSYFGTKPDDSNLSAHYKPKNSTTISHIKHLKEILVRCGFNEHKL